MSGAYYNEHDPYAASWLRNLVAAGHLADGEVDERSIVDVRPSDLDGFDQCHFFAGIGGWSLALRLAGWPDRRPVWTGSCPCQPFSAAGRRGGFEDARHLWPEFFRLIGERRPSIVLGEQVEAAVRLGWLDAVQADLEGAGYAFGAHVLGAHSVGAPHIRQRLWWVGVADAERSKCGPRRLQRSGGSEQTAGGPAAPEEFARDCVSRVVAPGLGPRLEGRDARALGNECEAAERGGATLGLGHSDSVGEGPIGQVHGGAPAQSARDPWSDLEWLPCRDGKARPTQRGLLPLVDGVRTGRVALGRALGQGPAALSQEDAEHEFSRTGSLRGAGNAIVPQVGAAWVEAVMDCVP